MAKTKAKRKLSPFGEWMRTNNLSVAEVASDLEVTPSYIYGLRAGHYPPGAELRIAINEYTEGEIGFTDWPKERQV